LICGSLAPHGELEDALAHFERTEAALSFSSGYATALGAIGALAGKGDAVVIDKLVHASIVDAARLSGAKLRVFAHNDLNELEEILRWSVRRAPPGAASPRPQTLIVTESVFSMDGDFAPLREMVDLKEKYGAWLMVDEAHATGLFGDHGRGRADESKVADRIEVRMGTLGKALGAAGGYVCGPKVLIEFLINRARSFIFSTAPAPATAAAARAAIELAQSAEGGERRGRLWSLVDRVRDGLAKSGSAVTRDRSAIIPLIIGGESEALAAAEALREQGIFVPAIRHPTVARGKARLRLTLTAAHTAEEAEQLLKAVAQLKSP
jgi:8-amino-7-oxononanoate synthase